MRTPALAYCLPRWARVALGLALLVVPGGSLALLLIWWLSRKRVDAATQPSQSGLAASAGLGARAA